MIKTTALEGLCYWSRFQADRGIDFNGFLWIRPAGNLLLDPMQLDASELGFVRAKGGARWILLTNFDHLRATARLKEVLGARVLAPAGERERFGGDAALVDLWFETADDLPPDLKDDVEVHLIRGGKSPVEAALFLKPNGGLLFGDAVRSHVSGTLRLLPDEKLADRAAVVASLQPLRALPVRGILLGDGDSIFYKGREAFEEFLNGLA